MAVKVKLSTTLRDYVQGYIPGKGLSVDAAGLPVSALLEKLGIPEAEVHIVMLNGRHGDFQQILVDGDRVGLFPAVGGG